MPFSPEKRRAYDKGRIRIRNQKGRVYKTRDIRYRPFVALDSEGVTFGPLSTITMPDGKTKTYQEHRTFMWMAHGGEHGHACKEPEVLSTTQEPYLSSDQILDWLTHLPKIFSNSIFVAFAFNYDVVQIFKDLPYEKLWELHNEIWWSEKDKEDPIKPEHFKCLYRHYKIFYRKGKSITIENTKIDTRITIDDTFSYFQSSFVKACSGVIDKAELDIIKEGKERRMGFKPAEELPFALRYTEAECRALCKIMDNVRHGASKRGLKPSRWHGPGALASAAIKKHGVRDHYFPMHTGTEGDPMPDYQRWAHHAYFGGRIELLKLGLTQTPIHTYDIKSAYPSVCVRLPSMKGGSWKYHKKVSRETLQSFSMLSIVHVKTCNSHLADRAFKSNFACLPYRLPSGEIRFPPSVHGYYMLEEVLAALEYEANGIHPYFKVRLLDAWEFVEGSDEKPFAFVQNFYDDRAKTLKSDGENQVLKLIINSLYGKTAQAVGSKVPGDANIWYAAAITAGTRAQLLRAAMQAPEACIMFATDGLYSLKPLDLAISDKLGDWEYEEVEPGAIFVKSGIYKCGKTEKARGIKPAFLKMSISDWISTKIMDGWEGKRESVTYGYTHYCTLGMAMSSETMRPSLGNWVTGTREVSINTIGSKRLMKKGVPNKDLVSSTPAILGKGMTIADFDTDLDNLEFLGLSTKKELDLSAMHQPDWINPEMGEWARIEREQENIMGSLA